MRQVIFIRHAKSSWEYNVSDKDRPLKLRGINDAHLLSAHLRSELPNPDAVFSSPANRALHTCMIFMRNLDIDLATLSIKEELYDFGGTSVLSFLERLADTQETVMLFGHNHAFTSLVNLLGNVYIDNVATSAVVGIHFDISTWKDINKEKGSTFINLAPKALK